MTDAPIPAQPKKSSPFPWIIGGCGCLLFGIGIIVAGIFFFVLKATEEPEKVVREFLSASASGDADRAYECFSPELKQEQSIEDFRSLLAARPQLFDVADLSYSKRSIDNGTATFIGTATLRAGGDTPCDFTLRQYENGWKLIGWHIGGDS